MQVRGGLRLGVPWPEPGSLVHYRFVAQTWVGECIKITEDFVLVRHEGGRTVSVGVGAVHAVQPRDAFGRACATEGPSPTEELS